MSGVENRNEELSGSVGAENEGKRSLDEEYFSRYPGLREAIADNISQLRHLRKLRDEVESRYRKWAVAPRSFEAEFGPYDSRSDLDEWRSINARIRMVEKERLKYVLPCAW